MKVKTPKVIINGSGSPLEDHPEILKKIGLFMVLFNCIDMRLMVEFFLVLKQSDVQTRPILDFLCVQDFSKKSQMLKTILGKEIYLKICEVGKFRNFIAHGSYGVDSVGGVSAFKIKRSTGRTGNYDDIEISEAILDKHIKSERVVLDFLDEKISKIISSR